MNYHDIKHDDLVNGDGLRVTLFVSGCQHHCYGCQNPVTWNPNDGVPFDDAAMKEIQFELSKDYVSGITFSGGDPLHPNNRDDVRLLMLEIKMNFKSKTIWLYSGYTWEQILSNEDLFEVIQYVDVLVDGRFEMNLLDKNAHWKGSTNQRVIDVQSSLRCGKVVLHNEGN